MPLTLSEYYAQVDAALNEYESLHAVIENQIAFIEDPELDPRVDWSRIMYEIEKAMNVLQVLRSIHMFERITKNQLEEIFRSQNFETGSMGKVIITITHEITDLDTPRGLEMKYGIAWEDILIYNNLTTEEFYEQSTILIPIPVRIADRITKDILVFGDQTGENIFGHDLTEELDDDGLGDFIVLEPRETIQQSMQILSTTQKGEISYQEDFGLDIEVGEDWVRESIESFLQMKIIESYKKDPRVRDVEITRINKEGTGLSADVTIIPIIGQAVFVRGNS